MSVTLKTNMGELKIELQCQKVPKGCKNFLALCAAGKYDGTVFHRNMKNFIIQGGDTDHKNGKGGTAILPEGNFDHEVSKLELRHDRRGMVAMAHSGKTQKVGSQFYITYSRQPSLDGTFTVIGKLIDGFDTLQRMEEVAVQDQKKHRPVTDIVIESCVVHANPIAEEEAQ